MKELQPAHLKECVKIMAGSDPWVTLGYTKRRAEEFFERYLSSGRCFVALLDGQVVGFVVFYHEEAFTLGGYIKTIGVRPSHRRRGIGRRMMAFAEEKILKRWPNVFLLVSDFNTQA